MKNTTYMQKLVMYGLEYTPEKSDKQTIVNYVLNMQDKKYDEKKEILQQFSWITWYKDGTFKF